MFQWVPRTHYLRALCTCSRPPLCTFLFDAFGLSVGEVLPHARDKQPPALARALVELGGAVDGALSSRALGPRFRAPSLRELLEASLFCVRLERREGRWRCWALRSCASSLLFALSVRVEREGPGFPK